MEYDPDKLDKLAELLDGVDDVAAEEARRMARDIRNLISLARQKEEELTKRALPF